MTHDTLCPWSGLGDYWADVCEDCHLIARVREDEKGTILQAAYESAPSQVRQDEVARIYNIGYAVALEDVITAIEADTEFDELGDQNHAVEIIEALLSSSFPNREEPAYNKEK